MKARILQKGYRGWRKLLPPYGGWTGLTLYPFVFLAPWWTIQDLRHELIHVWQVRRDGWLRFYVTWLWQRLVRGYRYISVELEAYAYDTDEQFLPTALEDLVWGPGYWADWYWHE